MEFVELDGVHPADAGAVFFGTRKIVGLSRALALRPSLLLLDEPSAGLSRDERDDLARFLLRIKHELKLAILGKARAGVDEPGGHRRLSGRA